jgi:FKBP-type peptidyl-prolyl cis-trans isomerase FkpA
MAEVTRVPLKPLSPGSLIMLFGGIVIGLLIAAAFAWATAPKGVSVDEIQAGTGENPKANDVVFVHYTGKLKDGTVFDQSQAIPLPVQGLLPEGTPLPLENMVPGFREAALQMQRGGKYTVEIPAAKAYGEMGRMDPNTGQGVPPNADLTFEIELVDFMPMAEVERRFQQVQQRMMQQQQSGEAGNAAPQAGAPAPVPAPAPAPTPQAAR